MSRKYFKLFLVVLIAATINILVLCYVNVEFKKNITLKYEVMSQKNDMYQVFFSNNGEFNEEKSMKINYTNQGSNQTMNYAIPTDTKQIRLDLGTQEEIIRIKNISINYFWKSAEISGGLFRTSNKTNDIESIKQSNDDIEIVISGKDPFIVINLASIDSLNISQINDYINNIYKIFLCILIDLLLCVGIKRYQLLKKMVIKIYHNKRMIWNLSKNDFKTKYAGSYLGIFWAFVQPVMTVLIYWFVFQVGFRTAPIENFPFVLWLVVGLVPWFFFSEAIINATNSMLEYSYLVKKVVFKIDILPIVKILSAFFIHIFFIGFAIVLFLLNGYFPTIHLAQVLYYTICTFILVLGISYATSAIIVFFKDLGQIIAIVLQMGLWLTPIIWSYNMVSEPYQWIFKLNPMFYIVEGYRDAFINHIWLWEHLNQTVYFWMVTSGLFLIGTMIFKKLKIHFADVL
ncbi:ABC transporter permease [Paenibacillus sp. MER TA 81-3]|uniref:ABC transporter permease n=1 Tax=Paenibacillus sp. MER TA 81-3 TaxID=2939573 RepID=UPI002040E5A5|nr:ABC transporter permease [Paenibacillus sp. MER TA 81-3]MCM3338819.1 ABC transporter permease [Paenibacillus sp. MER TA 81-3]